MDSSILTHKPTGKQDVTEVSEILEHTTAIRKVLGMLTNEEHGIRGSMHEIGKNFGGRGPQITCILALFE